MLNSEYKIILRYLYLALILLVLFFCFLDYIPMMEKLVRVKVKNKILRTSDKTLSKTDEETRERSLQSEFVRQEQIYELIRQETDDVKEKAKTDRNVPLVTLQIEDMANFSKIELTMIRPLLARQEDLYEILPIEIGFQSTYAALVDFIKRLEDCPVVVSVRDLSISKNEMIYPALEVKLVLDILFRSSDLKIPAQPAKKAVRK